jgi:hypothetical protein
MGEGSLYPPPDYETTQQAYAPKKAKRFGKAERDEKGVSRISRDCGAAAFLCAKEAKRSDHAERSENTVPFSGLQQQPTGSQC